VFLTLTYAPGQDYDPRQISEALKRARQWVDRRGYPFRYVWRFEFGSLKGRPHYHMIVWLPRGVTMPKWDKQGWWPHGMTNAVWARNPVGYMAKYASKDAAAAGDDFDVGGARWWGTGGLSRDARLRFRFRTCPSWLHKVSSCEEGDDIQRVRGWWRVGQIYYRTPYRFLGSGGGEVRLKWVGWTEWDVFIGERVEFLRGFLKVERFSV
jgi:hypothetical protein